jgi:spermidine/putrescine transport system permease protein
MAERSFSASRLPGFATIAVAAFVMLYLPIARW